MILDKDKFFAELDALGEQAVREKLAQGIYRKEKHPLIHEWLRKFEASRSEEILSRKEERELEANKIARSALSEAREANRFARHARLIAIIATIISAIAIIISVILNILYPPK